MEYAILPHARLRMKERAISMQDVNLAVQNPTAVAFDKIGRTLIKKLYVRDGKTRLLLLAGEEVRGILQIITVIDTSKVKKYL